MNLVDFSNAVDFTSVNTSVDEFFELSLDLLCIRHQNGYFLKLNSKWTKVLGWTVDELKERPWIEWVHPDDIAVTDEIEHQCRHLQAQKFYQLTTRYQGKDGHYRWLSWRLSPYKNGVSYGVVEDVTEKTWQGSQQYRTEIQKALRLREQAIAASSVGIVIADAQLPDMPLIYVNPAFEAITGYTAVDVLGKNCRFLQGTDRHQPAVQKLRQAIQEGTHCQVTLLNYRKDGTPFWNNLTISPIYDENNHLTHFVGVQSDISLRKHAAIKLQQQTKDLETAFRQLQQAQSQLIQSEKMSSLGQLVAGIAHELNNPVGFIYGNVSHVQEYVNDLLEIIGLYQETYPHPHSDLQDAIEDADLEFLIEDLPKVLSSIQVGSQRIKEIVDSLRNFSRLDEAEYKAVDIHEGINNTLMILQNRIKAKPDHPAIEIIQNYGNIPKVKCYPGKLNQVFMNILVNALDALDERDQQRTFQEIAQHPSCICITTEILEIEEVIRVKIQDNGLGIPEEIKQQIFDPFFTTKSVGKGTGLGMSISYQIVTQTHQGKLKCISSVGEGTEFIIEIPWLEEGDSCFPEPSDGNYQLGE